MATQFGRSVPAIAQRLIDSGDHRWWEWSAPPRPAQPLHSPHAVKIIGVCTTLSHANACHSSSDSDSVYPYVVAHRPFPLSTMILPHMNFFFFRRVFG